MNGNNFYHLLKKNLIQEKMFNNFSIQIKNIMSNKILHRPQQPTPKIYLINEYIDSLFGIIQHIDNSINEYHKLLVAQMNTRLTLHQTPFFKGEDDKEYNFYQDVLEELNRRINCYKDELQNRKCF